MARLAGLAQCSEEAERPRTEARDRSEVVRRAVRARILVIDDEPLFGQTMSMLLGGQHDVTVERSGCAALRRLLVDRDFDLVLCDLSLPDLDGPSLYEQVRRRDAELAGRFVFVTGGAFTDSTREFLKGYEGARLEKPFAISEVERLFELSRLSA
jgi:CheY-like chemotaxis protein